MIKAFFFDRDGIVNYRIPGDYVKSIDEFKFKKGFFELFEFIKNKGYMAILVTNQQGIGKGVMTENELQIVHQYMQDQIELITKNKFDAIYYCPDLELTNSHRRKPNPGMLLDAKREHNIELSRSWIIGDSISDIRAGKNAGTKTILIGNYRNEDTPEADLIFTDLTVTLNYLINTLAD